MTCPRIFCDTYSFFKHLSRHHSISSINNASRNSNNSNIVPDRDCSMEKIHNSTDVQGMSGVHSQDVPGTSSGNLVLPVITNTEPLQLMSSTSCSIDKNDNRFDFTVQEFSEQVTHTSALFVASLYSKSSIPRVFCQEMINSMTNFLHFVKMLEEKYNVIEPNPNEDLSAMFNIVYNAFAHHS